MSGGLIRRKDIIVDDVLDRIYKAWISHTVDEDLDVADRFLLERMEYIYARLAHGGKRALYKNLVEDTYQAFNASHDVIRSVTRRTIETDIARTKRFFLVARPRDEKEFGRGIAIEQGKRMLAKFEKAGKGKEWVALFKEVNALEGFHKEDLILPEYDSVQPPPLMVMTDPGDIGVPVIANLEEELRLLRIPKKTNRNTDNIDEAEDLTDDSE
jgi:hypothetical protein